MLKNLKYNLLFKNIIIEEIINIFCLLEAEFSYKSNGKLLNQLAYCEETLIPYCVIIGTNEITNNLIKIRNIATRNEVG